MLGFDNTQAVSVRWPGKTVSALLLLAFQFAGAFAQESALPKSAALTQRERAFAIQFLEGAGNKFFNSINGLSNDQMEYKTSPERWSIAEIAEHLMLGCERHVAQINEVEADATFPRSPQNNAIVNDREGPEAIVRHLDAAKEKFLTSVAGLSDEQLKFKPAADRWSVAEIAEHITLSESFLYDVVSQMLKSPANQEKKSGVPDAAVLQNAADRTTRFQTRDSLVPTGRWGTLKETLKQFEAARARTLALVKDHGNELRSHFAKFGSQEMDAHQWLLSLAGHCLRHTAQINEVKADPDFPGK